MSKRIEMKIQNSDFCYFLRFDAWEEDDDQIEIYECVPGSEQPCPFERVEIGRFLWGANMSRGDFDALITEESWAHDTGLVAERGRAERAARG